MGLTLRATTAGDLDFVLSAESDPDASPFVVRWSRDQHVHALADPDQAHLLAVSTAGTVGFVLLAGLTDRHRSIELRRIVVAPKGQRVGRRTVALVLDHAFGQLGAHRVWLDLRSHNERARRAYAAVGFVEEGVQRDALLSDGTRESLAVMSIDEDDWIARRQRPR